VHVSSVYGANLHETFNQTPLPTSTSLPAMSLDHGTPTLTQCNTAFYQRTSIVFKKRAGLSRLRLETFISLKRLSQLRFDSIRFELDSSIGPTRKNENVQFFPFSNGVVANQDIVGGVCGLT